MLAIYLPSMYPMGLAMQVPGNENQLITYTCPLLHPHQPEDHHAGYLGVHRITLLYVDC